MNLESYTLDTLRALVRSLQAENNRLKMQLDRAGISYESSDVYAHVNEGQKAYDLDQGGRIQPAPYITEEMAKQYFSVFWGRTDVFAKRGKKGGYFPQCDNRWDNWVCPKNRDKKYPCENCEHKKWTELTPKQLVGHLLGRREEITEHFAVFDEELVWHGGMNLLGKADVWDNLMRIKDQKVAEELMGMV